MRIAKQTKILILILMFALSVMPAYAQRKGSDRDTTATGKAAGKNDGKLKQQKNGKPLVIVIPSASSSTSWTTEITEAELENALVQSGRFTTLSRGALEAILKEQRLAQSDLVDPNRAPEVGKIIGADYIVYGKCLNAENKESGVSVLGVNKKTSQMVVKVQMQLLDVETSQIMDTFSYDGKAEASSTSVSGYGSGNNQLAQKEVYGEKMKSFATLYIDRINQLIPIEASVVLIKGNQVALDAGENASVKVGMEFDIFTDGEPIKNSAGEVLSYDRTQHGKVRVVRVEQKLSWCEIVQTLSDSGQVDSAPNPARIQRDFTAKQTNNSSLRTAPVNNSAQTPKNEEKKDKKDKAEGLKKKLPF